MDKKQLAHILEEIGTILEIKGENPFKSRAYFNAARVIDALTDNINDLVESGEIGKIKGIGQALSQKITTLVQEGELEYYDNLKKDIPPGLLDMLKIPGLGARKIKVIYEKLKITTIGELEYACRENRLRDLSGFGQKSQDNILQGIERHKIYSERFLYPVAFREASELLAYLKKYKDLTRIEFAGSLRRKKETIKDIDILATCPDAKRDDLMSYFTSFQRVKTITGQGKTKSSVVLDSGISADLRIVNEDEFAFALHHFTGSKEHNTAMRSLAKSKGLKMNEYGLFSDSERKSCQSEEEIFSVLDLQYIPPELRENMGEIEAAQKHKLPSLYDEKPFYGVFHVHTTYSDGAHSLKEIVNACRESGWQYVGICDHSKSAFYANGLDEDRIKKQHDEIDQLNQEMRDFTIFKGIESDILLDGSLDYAQNVLEKFDFIIASVHSNFNMPQDKMTDRVCRALSHPLVSMLGHPTGRLLLGREGYEIDMEKVIEVAGDKNKIIEINSSPYRLDLDWRLGQLANKKNIKTALNPDAHSIEGLQDYKYGIAIARKGWFETKRVINSYTADEVKQIFDKN